MRFDYFYGAQADQFSFYRVPKIFFTDDSFRDLSMDARLLYGILLERVSLSTKNGWLDESGRVYIICTLQSVMEAMHLSDKTVTKLFVELETFGLIERRRQGQGKPIIIYVKNFLDSENIRVKAGKSYESEGENNTSLESEKLRGSNTEINNTDFSNTNPILSDEMWKGYEKYFRDRLAIDALKVDYPQQEDALEGIVDLLVDTCCCNRKNITIAGDEKPVSQVRSRFMKLRVDHIRYVLDCMEDNTTQVKNIRQYLLAALYNAPATIDSFYRAAVNHARAEGRV